MSTALIQAVWYPHTNPPAVPVAAIIAIPTKRESPEDVGVILKPGNFMHNGESDGKWLNEDGTPLTDEVFWWMDESELVTPLEDCSP